MPELDPEWIKSQLEAAKVKVTSGKAILKLIATWQSIPELSPKLTQEVLQVFSKLVQGHAFSEDESDSNELWVPLQPGDVRIGDIVRVKFDAFTGSLAPTHNGRRGSVVAIRYGDIIVKSNDGKSPELSGVHYSPYKLEKLVRKLK